ncbi:hypothetical protein RP726_11675 [Candidatus Methylospira mobilis]|uniref:hypothetical protein n=1 Tax=Candidatus Methylospira mobilis TaxID=1808979 RepID=UPI0028EF4D0D|nr:hypothetical protein [Candidatus Methylospira mobilis]WNV03128.1 hypothetical protein RP726_11675 [Candidatus Methylospira mobilis]
MKNTSARVASAPMIHIPVAPAENAGTRTPWLALDLAEGCHRSNIPHGYAQDRLSGLIPAQTRMEGFSFTRQIARGEPTPARRTLKSITCNLLLKSLPALK